MPITSNIFILRSSKEVIAPISHLFTIEKKIILSIESMMKGLQKKRIMFTAKIGRLSAGGAI